MYENLIHQKKNGRWVIARWDQKHAQWQAPMTAEEAKLTGCHTYMANTLEGLGCTSYAHRSSAVRRLRREERGDCE